MIATGAIALAAVLGAGFGFLNPLTKKAESSSNSSDAFVDGYTQSISAAQQGQELGLEPRQPYEAPAIQSSRGQEEKQDLTSSVEVAPQRLSAKG